ncbi:MAG: sugar phosphate nucleotidyltransferase [Promethearchaeota archaeon]
MCPIAGVGKRLQPFTFSKPKAFLKLAGQKLIDLILNKLKTYFPKETNLCFVLGYKKRQLKEHLLKNYSDYFNIKFVEQKPIGYSAEEPYFSGLGDAILLTREIVNGDDLFIFLSDRLPLGDISSILLKFHQEDCDGLINVQEVEEPQYYGIVITDENDVIEHIVEKPTQFVSNKAVSGIYLFRKSITPKLFEYLEEQARTKLENGEERLFTPIIEKLISEGARIKINEMRERVLDFGRPKTLLEGNRKLLSELKLEDPLYEKYFLSGNIMDSKIIPPVYIGENAKIIDSIIGPNVSIGNDVFIEKCVLSESVIGDGVELKRIISSSSIIGDYSKLEDLIKDDMNIGDSTIIATSNSIKIKK